MHGTWDVGEMTPLAAIVLVSATILLVIMMLNLLIAIVNASFEKVTSKSIEHSFKEKVSIISDIYDIVGQDAQIRIRLCCNRLCCNRLRKYEKNDSKTKLMFLVHEHKE